MKIVFMGTPEFAVPSLLKLNNDQEIEVEAVVTQPDRKSGRGQKVHYSDIKEKALENDLEVMQSKNVNQKEFLDKLAEIEPDFIVVVAFGQKLSPELLEIPKYGCINLHASLLPEYRGSSPIHKAIIDGKKVTGNTTMYMDEGWDDGDIIYQQEIEIAEDDTVGVLHDKLAKAGAELLIKTLKDIEAGQAPRIKQDDSKATFAYKIDKSLGEIDWEQSAQEIHNLIRGVNPWPGAYTFLNGERLKLWQSSVSKLENTDFEPGTIVKANIKDGILVQTGDGILAIEKLQLPGSKKIEAEDFLNGYQLSSEEKLGTN
ncbi:methionyl-tRNA formyltransferase [Halanaerobium congolense]|jgi:methionyl-tRNA formyltransferase|uniref:Methionyl-tRNA formyltransferase n=1 Tax=Halanaerobium congolense TaxID=54121 RepID=A0A1H9YJL6_9FIRM|nr:methionyl-tRNA formyltransferase [Halanaerobium congolense]PTX16889.1 methionyl-tRNA formyltransferase [Halanaerobium congolense]SDE90334.1 methionyl-tRNA formyltransferase [Halanaerobium congolense]SES69140.1 methionyl-tRNA formyltransferase [Halanaerobium congolense]SFP02123.1 methionyl-tRNA formyltransferase [Halanaerobium congolense]